MYRLKYELKSNDLVGDPNEKGFRLYGRGRKGPKTIPFVIDSKVVGDIPLNSAVCVNFDEHGRLDSFEIRKDSF